MELDVFIGIQRSSQDKRQVDGDTRTHRPRQARELILTTFDLEECV